MYYRRLLAATAAFALFQGPAALAAQEAETSGDSTPPSQITSGAPDAGPAAPAAGEAAETDNTAPPDASDAAAPAATESSVTADSNISATGAVNADAASSAPVAAEPAGNEAVDKAAVATGGEAAQTATAADGGALTAQPAPGAAGNPLIQAAANYAQFRRDLNAVSNAPIDSAAALDAMMDRLAAHTPAHLSDAFIGYSALIAAQNKDFVDQVREVAEYFGRDQVVTGLLNDPAYVMTFKNTDGAMQAALASANDEEEDLLAVGERIKQKSYTLQHHDWAQQVVDRGERLALIESPSTPPAPQDYRAALAKAGAISSTDENAAVKREAFASVFDPLTIETAPEPVMVDEQGSSASEAVPTAVGGAANDTMTEIAFDEDEARSTNAIMTLAALEALGVGATRPEAMTRVMSKVRTQSCLDWAHTQLQVCVAAGHFKYEDAFCIAQHQLNQVAQCFGAVTAN